MTTATLPENLTGSQRKCAEALITHGGNAAHAADALHMTERAFRRRIAEAVAKGFERPAAPVGQPRRKPSRQVVQLDALTINPDLQPRVKLHAETVREYADIYKEHGPEGMDPIRVFRPLYSGELILTRGFTRVEAAKAAGLESLPAEVFHPEGNNAELLDSLGGNKHGLRLSNQDKRRALELYHTQIAEADWHSTREVADLIGCSHDLVASFRKERRAMPVADVGPHAVPILTAEPGLVSSELEQALGDVLGDALPPTWHQLADDPEAPIVLIAARWYVRGQPPRNLADELADLLDDDDEPISVEDAAHELGTDTATVLGLASTTPGLRATETDDNEPAVERISAPAATVETSNETPPKPTKSQADRLRREWLIEQAAPIIAKKSTINPHSAAAIAITLGLHTDGTPVDLTDKHAVGGIFARFALETLQEATCNACSVDDLRVLPGLLAALSDDLGLDWPALETAARARFD